MSRRGIFKGSALSGTIFPAIPNPVKGMASTDVVGVFSEKAQKDEHRQWNRIPIDEESEVATASQDFLQPPLPKRVRINKKPEVVGTLEKNSDQPSSSKGFVTAAEMMMKNREKKSRRKSVGLRENTTSASDSLDRHNHHEQRRRSSKRIQQSTTTDEFSVLDSGPPFPADNVNEGVLAQRILMSLPMLTLKDSKATTYRKAVSSILRDALNSNTSSSNAKQLSRSVTSKSDPQFTLLNQTAPLNLSKSCRNVKDQNCEEPMDMTLLSNPDDNGHDCINVDLDNSHIMHTFKEIDRTITDSASGAAALFSGESDLSFDRYFESLENKNAKRRRNQSSKKKDEINFDFGDNSDSILFKF